MDRNFQSTAKREVRAATIQDLSEVLRHRREMFMEMGFSAASIAAMNQEATPYFSRAFAEGTYHHWFIDRTTAAGETQVAAGAGVSVSPFYPGPRDPKPQRAWILNVYAAPDCRNQGLARQLVETAIAWCVKHEFASVYLHASSVGRSLYERLGFVSSNEMRLDL